jgi:spore maturation protein CgeB
MLNEFKINIVFISAKQSADFLKNELLKTNVYWMPEGINIDDYKFVEYSKKNIDIIQMGRKYDFYHMGILKFCTESQIKYLFEKNKGEIIFKTKEEFIDGLSRSKISICFHSSTTNPERSGNTSTMTQRYLQSMASKCLIVGNLPYDMLHLFDYNPIIEADLKNPIKQLREILTNFSTYIPLIEKNYEEVKKNHQWKNRIKTFKNIIN